MARTGYYWDASNLAHDTGHHVERIARAQRLEPDLLRKRVPALDARPVVPGDPLQWVLKVHQRAYVDHAKSVCARGGGLLDDGDTVSSAASFDSACMAVSAALTAADEIMAGKIDNAFCAMRPPGHHALPHRAMGFCLFATISILARYLQDHHRIGKIAIVDFDVHHGNGTQDIFYEDPSVFFVSLHQHPLWPGTGMASETGSGAGKGFTLNVPIAPFTSESDYLATFNEKVVPAVAAFRPEFVLVSAGYDAHADDPLGSLQLTEGGFAELTRSLRKLANEQCHGRIIGCLEGGYDLHALECSVAACVLALME